MDVERCYVCEEILPCQCDSERIEDDIENFDMVVDEAVLFEDDAAYEGQPIKHPKHQFDDPTYDLL